MGMKDYRQYVEDDRIDSHRIEDHIYDEYYGPATTNLSPFNDEYSLGLAENVAVFEFVAQYVDYVHTGSTVLSLDQMASRWTGDCEDQSVLLANLYESMVRAVRFVVVENQQGEGHLLLELNYRARDPEELCSDVTKVYREVLPWSLPSNTKFGWENVTKDTVAGRKTDTYLVADPVNGDYLGDINGLAAAGFVEISSSGWEWTRSPEYEQRPLPQASLERPEPDQRLTETLLDALDRFTQSQPTPSPVGLVDA